MDDLGTMLVSFQAQIDNLMAAPDAIAGAFDSIVSSAESMSSSLAEQSDLADESFNSIAEAGQEMSDQLQNLQGFNAENVVEGAGTAEEQLSELGATAQETASQLDITGDVEINGIGEAQTELTDLSAQAEETKGSVQDFGAASDDATESTGGLLSGVGDAAGGLLDFIPDIGMAAIGLQIFGSIASQAGDALLGPAAQAEQTQDAFINLMHSTKDATDYMQQLNDFAAKTPFQTMDIDQAAQKLMAYGIQTQNIIPDITGIGDALSSLGKNSPAYLEQVVDVFGKIQASGKLTAMDMMQLSAVGIPAWQMLAKSMGVTVPQLQDMVSKGLVPASVALPGLQKGMENTFGGSMARQADTFNGLMSTLKSNVNLAMAAFGTPLLKQAEGFLTNIGNELASKGFQTFASDTGVKIGKIFENLGEFASNPAFKTFAKEIGGDLLIGLEDVLDALASPEFGAFMKWVGDDLVVAIEKSAPYVDAIASDVWRFANVIDTDVQPDLEKFMTWWDKAWPGIALVLSGVWDEMDGIVEIAWALLSGIILIGLDLMTGHWSQAWTDLLHMLSGIWDGLKKMVKGDIEILIGILYSAGAGIVMTLEQPFKQAYVDIMAIWVDIQNIVSNIGGSINSVMSGHGLPGFAAGTNSAPGGLALVGEQGPELVNLPRGAQVIPLQGSAHTAAMASVIASNSSSSDDGSYTFIFEIDGRQFANLMGKYQQKETRLKLGVRAA